MPISPSPLEQQRQAAVAGLRLLNSPREERFDRVVRLAAQALGVPVAVLGLIDGGRVWFKSEVGLQGLTEVPREGSLFEAVLGQEGAGPLVVPDARRERAFRDHLWTARYRLRFFAGQPLVAANGQRVGVLAVGDERTLKWTPARQRTLADLATFAEQELRGLSLRHTLDRLEAAERRAEEQHARFAAFMDHLPNAAFMKDAEGRLVYVNGCHLRAFGREPEAVLGKRDDEWLPPEVWQHTLREDRTVLETGQPSAIAEDIPTAEGVRNWLTFKFPIPTREGGRLLGGVAVDLTAQKRTERELQELSALQKAILDHTAFSIISTAPDGTIRTFNRGSERLLGYRAEEVVGRATPALFHEAEEVAQHAAALSEVVGRTIPPGPESIRWGVEESASVENEWTFVRKDGSRFPAALSLTAVRDAAGKVESYVGVMHDISARRQAEEAMREAKETAEAANRAKSQFLANMSHEVRTPLNGILGVTEMLLEQELTPDQRQLAEVVQQSAEALHTLVNDILDFSKVEAGRVELEKIDFALEPLLRATLELHSIRAGEQGVVLEMELPPEVPAALHGDPLRLRQVISNLVGNAVKFSTQGVVRLAVSGPWVDGGEVRLRFAVHDEGIGIPPEKLAGIFDPFTQADLSTTRQYGGTGLGLSICRQLVELMGGTIAATSTPGAGSCFHFTAQFGQAEGPTRPREAGGEQAPAPLRRRLHVLLAEDSATNRLVATHQLRKLGCTVEVVEDGLEAVAAVQARRFDLVLMDGQMPRMDGYAATAKIREWEGTARHTPILALTANAMAGERERCLALGMDGFLSKPFRESELRALLEQAGEAPAERARKEAPAEAGEPLEAQVLAALRAECQDEEADLFPQYVSFFRKDAEQAREHLQRAAAERNAEELHRVAHRLRGSAANFGAHALIRLAAQVEQVGTEVKLAEALAVVPRLLEELTRVEAALEAELER